MESAPLLESLETEVWIIIGSIFLLLLLSGLFSGSETALTATSKARIRQMEKDGEQRATRVKNLLNDREGFIGAILLGNNLVNILATSLTTSLFLNLFGVNGVAIATIVMTILVLIFAEVLPKSYAISNAEPMALRVSGLIRAMVVIFSPLIKLIQMIVRLTLKIFGVNDVNVTLSSQEELRGAIDLHSEEGDLQKSDRHMLGSILDFDEISVEDVMIHRRLMQILDIDAPLDDLIKKIVLSTYTRLPLYRGSPDNIVGILHAKDVLRALRRAGTQMHRFNVERIMTKPWFVPETTTLREQLNAFLEKKSHFALVVDEYGDLQGLITLEDILEEIVGDIADEHDFVVSGVQEIEEGWLLTEGNVPIRDLNRLKDWTLPDTEATSIAGLVIYEAESIPIVGQKFTFHGFTFEVTGRRRNQITQIKMKKIH
ncbi:HlyC/CorC family transporter [Temperatibacter marinus]|uniref:HlyC/CorC family transporter n=1 Tax=Temperatibacter marinus TaxID=1456591 RepID=A0AA52HBN4_9PROT|nr:HlyC/CorC family transporter [Temperatibacter marinus]WND03818.1 HlyC/CorC family transporter [Temperatibacter marinus]